MWRREIINPGSAAESVNYKPFHRQVKIIQILQNREQTENPDTAKLFH